MRRSKGTELRSKMVGVKVEPSLAALVEEAADEEGRTTSTYLYRLIKADLERRGVDLSEAVAGYMPKPTAPEILPPEKPQNVRKKKVKAQASKPQPA